MENKELFFVAIAIIILGTLSIILPSFFIKETYIENPSSILVINVLLGAALIIFGIYLTKLSQIK